MVSCDEKQDSITADGPRDALSVKILSITETSCTTNPQQIAVIELEGYSWSLGQSPNDVVTGTGSAIDTVTVSAVIT